ncbi:hypothetical protein CDAR_105531 [Caerostris darwini]|uniref:Uncharacterized protein n=1 Tax=Caerostris darwini TaxID=1538125 RepID=A0AAV4N1J0_9ARAC|nr:hypothetical protein CDAR_105531 [Caerostris darwini]
MLKLLIYLSFPRNTPHNSLKYRNPGILNSELDETLNDSKVLSGSRPADSQIHHPIQATVHKASSSTKTSIRARKSSKTEKSKLPTSSTLHISSIKSELTEFVSCPQTLLDYELGI